MKFFAIAATLASVAVAANVSTTVTCPDCQTPSSTNDIVTRSPIPSTSCDSPTLTTVKVGSQSVVTTTTVYTITKCPATVTNCPVGQVTTQVMTLTPSGGGINTGAQTGGSGSNPTTVPIAGGAGRVAGGGAVVAIIAAIALL